MDTRNYLISVAYKAKGEYREILRILKNNEEVEEVSDDHCLTIVDEDYPKEFRELEYPPFVLFYRGNIGLLKEEKISVVGSRVPGEYSREATRLLADNKDEVIVSGMAKGIDAIAHVYAARTIAVLGSGILNAYPSENHELYLRLCRDHLVISEYPGNAVPLAHHFPFRNRLIAALGKEIYLMESNVRSGSMSTVNEALALSRVVKVLPFSLFDEKGENNNHLIEEGAELIERKDLGLTSVF